MPSKYMKILTFITSHAKYALTSQNGDGTSTCVIWFTFCVWPELDMNGWTHFSFWTLWFTSKAAANSWAPSSLIWFHLRLQNVREREMRGGSTNLFTLCKVYLVSVPHHWDTQYQTLCVSLSVSEVEDNSLCGYCPSHWWFYCELIWAVGWALANLAVESGTLPDSIHTDKSSGILH